MKDSDGGMAAVREVVEVLHVSGDRAYVRGSINDGDKLIADGVHRIAPGTLVAPLPEADASLAQLSSDVAGS